MRTCGVTHVHAQNEQREIRKDAETCILSFFNSIFIHRYKDHHPEVRAKCTETVGKLIMEYSSKFLDNVYLKYIGWALYDKHTDVRVAALDAVDKFYNSQLANNLEAFTTRFRYLASSYRCRSHNIRALLRRTHQIHCSLLVSASDILTTHFCPHSLDFQK